MRRLVLLLAFACLVASCGSKPTGGSGAAASADAQRYPLKGVVTAVDKANKKATIKHEAVEGYMPAMTMEFPVHADWVWEDLSVGSEVRAELVVDPKGADPYWLENIGIVAMPQPGQSVVPVNDSFAQIGQEVPNFTLTNQDGKRIGIADFRGKALAITFIYAKCPLPDYCIRMSTNFSDTAMQIAKSDADRDKLRLLSISFDPENDTPAKLRSYGIGYLGNDPKAKFDVWQLAVGDDKEVRKVADFFGLRYQRDPNDKTVIDHSLRTAVIDPQGKVTKIFTGNSWTPAQLLTELRSAAGM